MNLLPVLAFQGSVSTSAWDRNTKIRTLDDQGYGVNRPFRFFTVAKHDGYLYIAKARASLTIDFCGGIDVSSFRIYSQRIDCPWGGNGVDGNYGKCHGDGQELINVPNLAPEDDAHDVLRQSMANALLVWARSMTRNGLRATDCVPHEDNDDEGGNTYQLFRAMEDLRKVTPNLYIASEVDCTRACTPIAAHLAWSKGFLSDGNLYVQPFWNSNSHNHVGWLMLTLSNECENPDGMPDGDECEEYWDEELCEYVENDNYATKEDIMNPPIDVEPVPTVDWSRLAAAFAPAEFWNNG